MYNIGIYIEILNSISSYKVARERERERDTAIFWYIKYSTFHTGEYPWQVAILKKDPTESVYVCGGTLISSRHIITAAHCVKTHAGRDLRARLGEWDVNHDVEFYPYIERDIVSVFVHPEFYAGTLANDIAILKLDHDVDFGKNPHISPACLPDKHDDFTGAR